MNLCDALESRRFLNGQMIIVQGDQANGMYFIESGVSRPMFVSSIFRSLVSSRRDELLG